MGWAARAFFILFDTLYRRCLKLFIIPRSNKSLHRNLAQEFIYSGLRRGLKHTEIVKQLKAAGLGYHTQNMFADVKGWDAAIHTWKDVNERYAKETIPSGIYVESDRKLESNFETVVKVNYVENMTGIKKDRYITVKHEFATPFGTSPMVENMLSGDAIRSIAEETVRRYPIAADVLGSEIVIGWRKAENA